VSCAPVPVSPCRPGLESLVPSSLAHGLVAGVAPSSDPTFQIQRSRRVGRVVTMKLQFQITYSNWGRRGEVLTDGA
jgi:hypothetical protein